jgi:hypothetical protein
MKVFFLLCIMVRGSFAGADAFVAKPISFEGFEKLTSGAVTKANLTRLLGPPIEVVDFNQLPNSKERGVTWKYDGLTVSFDEGADTANSWAWHVSEGASEQNLKNAMKRYAGATWEPETVKWINPHHFPNECYFKDKKQGISIEYNRARQEVFSIVRWDPSRKIASAEAEEKPPPFCIGNSCTPAMSSKEFFKESPISKYCMVPE